MIRESSFTRGDETVLKAQSQTTLRHQISCTGIGLHSGKQIHMCLRPAAACTGVVFKRIDVPRGEQIIPARYDRVNDTVLGTTLANEAGAEIATVEHLMAALLGCGVDNVLVELDGPEVPIMDGSASPFVFLIECAGLRQLTEPRRFVRILETVRVDAVGGYAELSPGEGLTTDFEIEFNTAVIERQAYSFAFSRAGFKIELARARTFGFLADVEGLRKKGRAQGGSLDNSVVIDGDAILNRGGLRYSNEFVRHKVLDAIGDLYLAGGPVIGHFTGVRSGHRLTNLVLREVFNRPDSWTYETLPDSIAPVIASTVDAAPVHEPISAVRIA